VEGELSLSVVAIENNIPLDIVHSTTHYSLHHPSVFNQQRQNWIAEEERKRENIQVRVGWLLYKRISKYNFQCAFVAFVANKREEFDTMDTIADFVWQGFRRF
jgi:hypothetical protein